MDPYPFTPPSSWGEKPVKRWFLDWQSEHYDKEMLMGLMVSEQRSPSSDLLQNCDLPPPLKLFSPVGINPMHPSPPAPTSEKNSISKVDKWEDELGVEHPSLLRALQLSQTRAREAEKKAALAISKNEEMAALLLEESMRLYAHRQWMKLLEIKISLLQKTLLSDKQESRDSGETTSTSWGWTLALCLGIAGVSFALSRYMF